MTDVKSTSALFSESYPVDVSTISLVWKGLAVRSGSKVLLHESSGVLHNGITAILAPTGSGKTTLLNALVGATRTATVVGEVRLNGKVVDGQMCKTLVSYVPQDDVLDGNMTVEECLTFAANMQLGHLPEVVRQAKVTNLLEELGINHVRGTLIGSAAHRGVSGGQRRRVSVACGLLREPRVMVLDEPTCGLDSTTALRLVETLHRMASKCGVAIVMAIHQPQQAIFNLFDNLLCLRGGRLLYHGGARACIELLDTLGFPHDGITGYADHVIEIISPGVGESIEEKHQHCLLLQHFVMPEVDLNLDSDVDVGMSITKQSWTSQFLQCFGRLSRSEARKYGAHGMNLVSTLGCSFLIGGAYYNIPPTQAGSKLRIAVLFFCCVNQSLFGAMKVILAFPDLRALALAERRAGLYSTSPFFLAFCAVDLLYTLVWPFLFAIPVVFLAGLQTGARFLGFVLILYLDKVCATSLAMMISSFAKITSTAVIVLPMALEASRLFSGYYLAPNAVPTYYEWLDPLSYVKYAYVGATLNELPVITYNCVGKKVDPITNLTVTGICDPTLPTTGAGQIKSNGYDFISYGGCIGVLIGYLIFTRIIAYLGLRFVKS